MITKIITISNNDNDDDEQCMEKVTANDSEANAQKSVTSENTYESITNPHKLPIENSG